MLRDTGQPFGPVDLDRDTPFVRKLHGIVEQVNQHLAQLDFIRTDVLGNSLVAFKHKLQMLGVGFQGKHVLDVV